MLREIKILAPRVISNLDKIAAGTVNQALSSLNLLDERKEQEAERRRVICENCPFNSVNAQKRNGRYEYLIKAVEKRRDVLELNDLDLSYKTFRDDLHCSLCACNIDKKTHSMDSVCGIDYFNKTQDTNLPILWDKFEIHE